METATSPVAPPRNSQPVTRNSPKHIVLATFGSHGDVHPFVGMGKVLQARGHEVVVHTSEYFRTLVEAAGLRFSGYGTAEQFAKGLDNKLLWSRRHGYKAVFGIGVKEGLRQSYEELARVVTRGTVLVGSSLALAARVAQEKIGCAGATVHLAPAIMRSCERPSKLPGVFMPAWLPDAMKRKIWEVGDKKFVDPLICPTLNGLRAELGLGPVERVLDVWWNHPGLIIGMWPEFFGPRAGDWPGHFRHAGFPLYDEAEVTPPSRELLAFLDGGEPPIAFTPGSAMMFGHRFFEAAVRTCKALGRRGVLLTRHAEQIPRDLPPTVFHASYAPFSTLLPRCAAAVHHGGIGTTAQAMRAGIPQVVVHFSHDQPDNAIRLERLGVGAGVHPFFLGGRRLGRALDRLLSDPHVTRAAKSLAGQVGDDGLLKAAELIEGIAVPA